MKRFAIIGVAGYVAPRHLQAIKEVNGRLVAAMDISDSVGILDKYFPSAAFFTVLEDFEQHLQVLKEKGVGIDYLVVCTPNHLHHLHVSIGLRMGADVICEKPLVLHTDDLKELKVEETASGCKIYTILQLRVHPVLKILKEQVDAHPDHIHQIELKYITPRGLWYQNSWKGDVSKSGGLATNIGIHLFDLLIWLFGEVKSLEKKEHTSQKMSGSLLLEKASVQWVLSIDAADLEDDKKSVRQILIDGELFEFDNGFSDLHTTCYKNILSGNGFGIDVCEPSIRLVQTLR